MTLPNIGTNELERILMDLQTRITNLEKANSGPLLVGTLEFSSAGGQANYGNLSTWITVAYPGAQALPTGTRAVMVTVNTNARAGANAACFWRLGIDLGAGGMIIGAGNARSHNNGDPANGMGYAGTAWYDRVGTGTTIRPYLDVNVDGGGNNVWINPVNFVVQCFR